MGNSGSGKTTFARELAAGLGVPHLELDSVFHQPGWQELDTGTFRQRVAEFTSANSSWVIDGNYSKVQDIVWGQADTVAWLDPSRTWGGGRGMWRTLGGPVSVAELGKGIREPVRNFLRLKPEESIIAWAWTRHHVYRERYLKAQSDPANAHLTFIRLRTPAEGTALVRRAADTAHTADTADAQDRTAD